MTCLCLACWSSQSTAKEIQMDVEISDGKFGWHNDMEYVIPIVKSTKCRDFLEMYCYS